ncbi:alpha/beta fold hydrolase [Tunicatimonas pelagia]|uniref:alpha/beta fold hydrolase n=1 Tax=Tunicatimonas pelagia TaxID=931531 RepID=UPI0026668B5D|nr:alpha/beta hydrolase [Tunicatimonas pelagia]WKN46183.1 alpha/beta hydrolase [Tunicatimonas pelagia]
MIVYFISGLGADEQAFRYIKLPNVEKRFIRWIPPQKRETLKEYTTRLLDQIDTTQPVTLIGLSFGGIVAQELASMIHCERLILISSVKQPEELSPVLRFIRSTRLYRLFPFRWVKPVFSKVAPYWFSALSDRHRALLKVTIDETDDTFAEWAIEAIMLWKGSSVERPVIHLHGTHDRIFPVRHLHNYVPVKRGGHFMIVTHAKPISQLLQKYVKPALI